MPGDESEYKKLLERVRACGDSLIAPALIGYRSARPRYARPSLLISGEGSRAFGGRWNPMGVAAVYASLSISTALAEALSQVRYGELPEHLALPRTFVAIRINLHSVLDITDGQIRVRLGVSEQRMFNDDWRKALYDGRESLCQRIGRAAREAGFEGLLVRSVADHRGCNLVWFPDRLLSASEVEVMQEG